MVTVGRGNLLTVGEPLKVIHCQGKVGSGAPSADLKTHSEAFFNDL